MAIRMKRYKNLSGDSGVHAHEFDDGSITVEFQEGTDASAARENVRTLQQLAQRGAGRTTFINRVVRERYAKRLH